MRNEAGESVGSCNAKGVEGFIGSEVGSGGFCWRYRWGSNGTADREPEPDDELS